MVQCPEVHTLVTLNNMLFRPFSQGIIALIAVFLSGGMSLQAQGTTDLAAWKAPQNADAVPDWARRMLSNRDLRDATGTAREELLARTLAAIKDIASDSNVVPSTRYNAILAAGQLVSVEPSLGNPPVAYPDALPYLIEVYQRPNAPHYLKYGALLGIVRHTNLGIEANLRDKVIDLLLDTVLTEFVPGENTLDSTPFEPAAWGWFRQTALEGLSALKTVGSNNKVVTDLIAVINCKSEELEDLTGDEEVLTRSNWERSGRVAELAAKAAKTLGDLNYSDATDIDAKKIADAFIRLTKAVCEINGKIAAESTERGGTSPDPAVLLERIVINVKMCTQSVVWGFRSSLLTGKPAEESFYTSLGTEDTESRRMDMLLAEVTKLSTFLDEGDGTRRPVLGANLPKEFLFNLSELRDALARTSEALQEKREPVFVP